MCPKYMWLDMPDEFCCRLSLFRVFAQIKKTVSTSPGLPYSHEYFCEYFLKSAKDYRWEYVFFLLICTFHWDIFPG